MTLPIRQAREKTHVVLARGYDIWQGMVCFKWPELGCSQADYLSPAPSACLSRAVCPLCLIHSCSPTLGVREDK